MRLALQVLKENQLYAKLRKCEFLLRSIAFLGHDIFGEGVKVDPKKIHSIRNCPRLLTSIDIRSFWGLARYFRRFVDGF